MSDAPVIDLYTDYRRYVMDAMEHSDLRRKDLAKALGISASMLSQVLSYARKLKPDLVEPLGEFLKLDVAGRSTLAALVDLDNDSARARRLAWATIQARQEQLASLKPPTEDRVAYHEAWHHGAVLSLAACDGFRPDPKWLAQTLVPGISEQAAAESLQLLLRMGLLAPDDAGQLSPTEKNSWTDSRVDGKAIGRAIAANRTAAFGLAAGAVSNFQWNERYTSDMILHLTESQFLAIRARLLEHDREIMRLTESVDADAIPDRLYMLVKACFPLSNYTDRDA